MSCLQDWCRASQQWGAGGTQVPPRLVWMKVLRPHESSGIFQGVCRRKNRLLPGLRCLFLDGKMPIEPSFCLNLHHHLGQGIICGCDSLLLLAPTHLRFGHTSLGGITQCRHRAAPVLWVPRMACGLDGNLGFSEAQWGHLMWVALIHWHLWHLCPGLTLLSLDAWSTLKYQRQAELVWRAVLWLISTQLKTFWKAPAACYQRANQHISHLSIGLCGSPG